MNEDSSKLFTSLSQEKKNCKQEFASSNIYFTSENFPLINEDGDKSNSQD